MCQRTNGPQRVKTLLLATAKNFQLQESFFGITSNLMLSIDVYQGIEKTTKTQHHHINHEIGVIIFIVKSSGITTARRIGKLVTKYIILIITIVTPA